MRAGKLRHRITIQSKSTTSRGTYGEEIITWGTYKQVWAELDPPKAREFFANKQTQTEITTRIRIRYLENIDNSMRIIYDGRTFDINAIINPDEKNKELILMCNEYSTSMPT